MFGGYFRYLQVLSKKGEVECSRVMQTEICNAHINGFERDSNATSLFLDLVFPYAYYPLVDYTNLIPMAYKMNKDNGERKIVLKLAATEAGLPDEICSKPKKAIQYSSGIHKIISKLF
jgi:asparagine synthase (glutamine-hydrolysing)